MTDSAISVSSKSMDLVTASATPFDQLPSELAVRAFGVDYAHTRPPEGGDLWLTRYGWSSLVHLLPANWHADRWYSKRGQRLPGATGNVYRVLTKPVDGSCREIVVKFSRVAQDVPIEVQTSFHGEVPLEALANARVNSPMEEFGLVTELRRGGFGPPDLRILTQHPLGIYAPPEEYQLWQLGRSQGGFHVHRRLLAEDQEDRAKAIELDIRRIYVLLYGWVKGKDAQEQFEDGELSEEELESLTPRVTHELWRKGFRVLDNKPKHFILRKRHRDGSLMRHHGELTYALVDFEFLQRTPDYHRQFKIAQRARYWQLLRPQVGPAPSPLPPHLQRMTIFGTTYSYGTTADGGKLWVVGEAPELFDYFLPERWRRSPRVKLSLAAEVYRTRSRDNIHLVYYRSPVGTRPTVDPAVPAGQRIREHGYNSPFEEVAIAERLRQMGIATTHPRAIYRTGHRTTKAIRISDPHRFESHRHLVTPEMPAEPVLSPDHDYYIIWGCYRGTDPQQPVGGDPVGPVVDLEEARVERLLDDETYQSIAGRARQQLQAVGFAEGMVEDQELTITLDDEGNPKRNPDGEIEVTMSIDLMTAYDYDLVDEVVCRRTFDRLRAKLSAVDCEKLDLGGRDLLLAMHPDGRIEQDATGELSVVLCNFGLIRGLYRPIR